MSCLKKDFLRIYTKTNLKNLQANVDKNILKPNNYTPNIDFLNETWEGYKNNKCNYFDTKMYELKTEANSIPSNVINYTLQTEKIDFLDRLKFECQCSKTNPSPSIKKIIKEVSFDKDNIPAAGGKRTFTIKGDRGAVFSVFVTNEDSPKKYYNFSTKTFSTTRNVLENLQIKNNYIEVTVHFPIVTDDDHYDINMFHKPTSDARFIDNSIDVNSSKGSDSAILQARLYQYTNNTITLSASSVNSLSGFSSSAVTTKEIFATKGKSKFKIPFTIVFTANIAKPVYIASQPTENNIIAFVERTIGSAALPIDGEDVSESTYYKWPIDNTVGLKAGMRAFGTNVTAYSRLAPYYDTTNIEYEDSSSTIGQTRGATTKTATTTSRTRYGDSRAIAPLITEEQREISKYGNETVTPRSDTPPPVTTTSKSFTNVFVPAVERSLSVTPTVTNGITTSWPGNIVFNKKQADALKDDSIKIVADGPGDIKTLTGYEFKVTNLKAELTKISTTTTEATSSHATIAVAQKSGVINNISRLSGIGINPSLAGPLVTSGGNSSGAGDWVMDATQTLENGQTLTIDNTGRVITITGDIEFSQIGEDDLTLRFDIDQFLAYS